MALGPFLKKMLGLVSIDVKIEYLCTPDSWCSVGNSMTSLRPDSATLQIADDK